tara:strand:+ start:3170 stop:4018 length:849 start_codon:yes stop_codon:yes gene_type:complete
MKKEKEYIRVKDSFLSMEFFSLFIEKKTELLHTRPKPKEENLPAYYESTNYLSHNKKGFSLTSNVYFISRKIMLFFKFKHICRFFLNPGKVVDVGSGTGFFLSGLKKKGWSVVGVEPNQKAREHAESKDIDHIKELKDLKIGSQDLVTFWHSLEHVYKLEETLYQAKNALKNEGILLVACPNYTSWDASYYKEDWAAWDVPRHLQHFSPNSLKIILEPLGFVQLKKTPLVLDAFYISIMSESQKGNRFSFLKGLFIGLTSNLIGLRTDNYSTHMYIFQKKEN